MKDETKDDVTLTSASADPIAAAESARLRYVGDWQTGFSRKQTGKKFTYIDAHGRRLRDQTDHKRIAALRGCADCESQAQIKRNIVQAVERVARILGNTKAVCPKCYIHPAVIEAYSSGVLSRPLRPRRVGGTTALRGLAPDEAALLALINQRVRPSGATGKSTRKTNASAKIKRLSKMFVAHAFGPLAREHQWSAQR